MYHADKAQWLYPRFQDNGQTHPIPIQYNPSIADPLLNGHPSTADKLFLHQSFYTIFNPWPTATRWTQTPVQSITGVKNPYNSPKTYISICRSSHYGFTYGCRHVKMTAQHVCSHCAMNALWVEKAVRGRQNGRQLWVIRTYIFTLFLVSEIFTTGFNGG